jgi:bis(5'-nucleosidyl)-tetraphosphatase
MKNEFSAGAVIYRINPETKTREYLILHYGAGHWDFAKGKLEKGETPQQAAVREAKEETDLSITLDKDFEQSISYFYKDKDGNLVAKKVVFFLAKVDPKTEVTLSYEHVYYKWLPYEDATKQLSFTNARQLLQLAEQHISTQD